jgi:DNA-binding CsgD family transcriptional regulator
VILPPVGVAVAEGSVPTPREMEVLLAFAMTGSTAEVGKLLRLGPQTVRNHLHAIHLRLGVATSVEAVWILRTQLEALGPLRA